MELISQEKDKVGRPVLRVSLSDEEIAVIKNGIMVYPKHTATDDPMDRRLKFLSERTSLESLSQQNISDIKEVINWNIQNIGSTSLLELLNDKFHDLKLILTGMKS